MGHGIARALREHSREQVSQAIAARSAIGVGAALLGLGRGSADIAGVAYQSLIATRFSRTHENEADRIGLEFTARAGYDLRAATAELCVKQRGAWRGSWFRKFRLAPVC